MKTPGFVTKAKFMLKAKSPYIKAIAGAGMVVGGAVLACKATLKAKTIVDSYKEEKAAPEASRGLNEDSKKEDGKRNLKLVKDITVTYAAPALLIGGGLVLGFGGFTEMHKRYIGAVATCGALQESFNKYRASVAKKIGTDEESNLYHGLEYKDVKVLDENGKEKIIKKAPVQTEMPHGILSVPFIAWDPNSEMGSTMYNKGRNDLNLLFLKNAQMNLNDRLKIKKKNFIMLGEVLNALGMSPECLPDPTMAYTWGFPYKYGSEDGDNCVDFGIWDAYWDYANAEALDYARQQTRTLWIEFNAVPLFAIDERKQNRLEEFLGEGNPEYDK